MKFKVGDPVWCLPMPGHKRLPHIALAATIVKSAEWVAGKDWFIEIEGYPADSPHGWAATESILWPRRPPAEDDTNALGSWDLCPWQPEKIRV